MRLRDWIVTGITAIALLFSPTMFMPLDSPLGQGYVFLEQLEPTSGGFDWMKNPVGKPIKNYATGVRAHVFHIVEVVDHWDLAGEVVLDWQHRIVFPFGYFHDIFAGNYKVVLSPTTEQDAEDGQTIIMGRVKTEKAAKVAVVLMWAKLKGMYFKVEPDKPAPIQEASL